MDGLAVEISLVGFAKRASSWADCWDDGSRARFLVGRWEWREVEVGMDSGMFSDMFVDCLSEGSVT